MKKILLATLTAGAITAVGGIAVATINQNQIGVPMNEEPQTIIEEPEEEIVEVEYVDTPEEADIVVEKIIDEPVKPKAEVIEPKEEPKQNEDEEIDPAYKALCDYVLTTSNPNQLEALKIYKEDAHKWLVQAGYESVIQYLQDPNSTAKVHYPRSVYQTFYGLYMNCLNKK